MQKTIDEITACITAIVPNADFGLRPGAAADELDSVEQTTGLTIPEELKQFLSIHDGQKLVDETFALIGGFQMMSCSAIKDCWRDCVKQCGYDVKDHGISSLPAGKMWNSEWLEIGKFGEVSLVIDCRPNRDQQLVFTFSPEGGPRKVVALGITDLFNRTNEAIKNDASNNGPLRMSRSGGCMMIDHAAIT